MNREEHLRQLQSYNFAAYDMLLYLDTHPNDRRAFELFRSLVAKTKAVKSEFEKEHGPLMPWSAAEFDTFRWLESPWPWEKEDN